MAKFVCTVCGYVFEGEAAPEFCPVCKAPASKFTKQEENMTWAAEHVVGVAQGVSEDILADLRANFQGECTEVGMYLAMARVAHREGYPEIGLYWEKAAYEEAEQAIYEQKAAGIKDVRIPRSRPRKSYWSLNSYMINITNDNANNKWFNDWTAVYYGVDSVTVVKKPKK